MLKTKQEIIAKINELEVERIKLVGALELLAEQEKPVETAPAQ